MSAKGTRLPADWSLPTVWEDWARTQRPDLDLLMTAESFADYWHAIPGAKGLKLDWLATWRRWVRHEPVRVTQGKTVGKYSATVAALTGSNRNEVIDVTAVQSNPRLLGRATIQADDGDLRVAEDWRDVVGR